MAKNVILFALSTCGWCKKTKRFLEDHNVAFECLDVDTLEGETKEQARERLAGHNPRRSYPTLVVDEKDVVVGYDEDRIREVLGL